jgi:hypothetical protein
MGLRENTTTELLALNGLDVIPNSVVSIEATGPAWQGWSCLRVPERARE